MKKILIIILAFCCFLSVFSFCGCASGSKEVVENGQNAEEPDKEKGDSDGDGLSEGGQDNDSAPERKPAQPIDIGGTIDFN